MTNRAVVKRAVLAVLDELATEHPSRHQPDKAARYVLATSDGTRLEIMVQKDAKSPPNIWVIEKAGRGLRRSALPAKASPSGKLWKKSGKNSRTYGRHTGLLPMDQLAEADLLYFTPENLEQVGTVIDHLLGVTAADIN
jgi:hypothetical protein